MRECRSETVTSSKGICFRRAVQTHSHRCASTEADEKIVIGAWCGAAAAVACRFVRSQVMFAAGNFLQKADGITPNDYVGIL